MAPLLVPVGPPRHARTMYKQVALDGAGRAWSLYDGVTPYMPGATLWEPAAEDHGGGLYCFRKLEQACVNRDDQILPPRAAMRHRPRAIARVLAWNDDHQLPVVYGSKFSYTYMHVVDIAAMPETWAHATPQHRLQPCQGLTGARQLATSAAAGAGGRGGIAAGSSLARRQAETLRLQFEVEDMERHVDMARATLLA